MASPDAGQLKTGLNNAGKVNEDLGSGEPEVETQINRPDITDIRGTPTKSSPVARMTPEPTAAVPVEKVKFAYVQYCKVMLPLALLYILAMFN